MFSHRIFRLCLASAATAFVVVLTCFVAKSEDKKPEESPKPVVNGAAPLGLSPGVATKITLHGKKLDKASEVKTNVEGATVTLGNKEALPPPGKKDSKRIDDSRMDFELTLPENFTGDKVELIVISPDGESALRALRVVAKANLIAEKEPNNGLREAQKIERDQTIAGAIQTARDVDVFAYEGKAGEKLTFELFAARYGSPLDSIITLYDEKTHIIGTNDDSPGSTDSKLSVSLPADGVYYLAVIDAHDHGGPEYVYQLNVTGDK